MTWEEFKKAFIERFLSRSVRKERAREFKDFKQLLSMTVVEYDVRFTQLSSYAPYLALTEWIRIERFINWLVRPLYRVVAPQMKNFPSYLAIVD